MGDSLSELCNVLSGVPQGSVLGPLLLVIFINGLLVSIQFATPYIFADDTKCLHLIRSDDNSEKLQADINNVSEWSYSSDLPFNEAKFVHLCFWVKTTKHSIYVVNGKPIKQLLQHKDLGVTFSTDLNWTPHCNIITAKSYQTLGLIKRTFKTSCTEAKNNCILH